MSLCCVGWRITNTESLDTRLRKLRSKSAVLSPRTNMHTRKNNTKIIISKKTYDYVRLHFDHNSANDSDVVLRTNLANVGMVVLN